MIQNPRGCGNLLRTHTCVSNHMKTSGGTLTEQIKLPHDWETVDDIIVAVTAPGDIDSQVWTRYVGDLKQPHANYVLSLVRGAVSIDAVKRNEAASTVKDNNLQVIVITESRLTRGVLTAVAWMGANITALSWNDLEKAFDKIKASDETRLRILTIADAFIAATPDES